MRRHFDPTLSVNCRAQHGQPHRPAEARCTGCEGCSCHAVRPPADFRERVVARRAEREQDAPGTRGEARPGADGGRG